MFTLLPVLVSLIAFAFYRHSCSYKENVSIYDKLIRNRNEFSFNGYEFPPFVFKDDWDNVLEEVREIENDFQPVALPDEYITVRMKINKMDKYRSQLHGLTITFENLMKNLTIDCMKKFNADWGFTHDGVVVLVIHHKYNMFKGRRDKYLTSIVSYISNKLAKEIDKTPIISGRISISNNLEDAMKPFIWSLHISGVNGISIKSGGFDRNYIEKTCEDKMKFLADKNLLPLNDHEAYGLVIKRSKETIFCGMKSNENGYYIRTRYKVLRGNTLNYLPEHLV